MKINKLNYELYIVDYLEGTLDAELKLGFDDFLQKYPEIQEEINMYLAAPKLAEDKSINYEYKDSLKKNTASNLKGWGVIALLIFALTAICIVIWLKPKSSATEKQTVESLILGKVDKNISVDKDDVMRVGAGLEPSVKDMTMTKNKSKAAESLSIGNTETVVRAIPEEENEKSNSLNTDADIKQSASPVQVIELNNMELNPVFLEKVIRDKVEPAKIFSKQKKDNKPSQNKEMVMLDRLELRMHTITVATRNDLAMDMAVDVMDIEAEQRVAKRKKSWKDIFIPKAYRDIELNEVMASQELKTAAEEIGDAMLPLSLTK